MGTLSIDRREPLTGTIDDDSRWEEQRLQKERDDGIDRRESLPIDNDSRWEEQRLKKERDDGIDRRESLPIDNDSRREEQRRLQKERDDAIRRAEESEEQLNAMINATRVLTQLVAKGSTREYRSPSPTSSLFDNFEHREGSAKNSENEDILFDELDREWKLEDTGITRLYSSCKAMANNLRLTQGEADDSLHEMVAAKHAASAAEDQLKATRKALNRLWKENSELKRERKRLVRDVRRFVKEANISQKKKIDEVYAHVAHGQMQLSSDSTCSSSLDLDDDDHSSISLSPITDDSQATLQFKHEALPAGDVLARWTNKQGQNRSVYKITFSDRKEVGIKLYPLPLNPKQGERRPLDSPPRRNLVSLQVDVGKLWRRPLDAFIVCGFVYFGTCSSTRPILGARLVAVDDVSVEFSDEWTMKKVAEKIRSRNGPVSLSFRNDILTSEQISYLNENLNVEDTMNCDEPAIVK